MAYGFVDINFDTELSVMKHQPGSYYFFIPQVNWHVCKCNQIMFPYVSGMLFLFYFPSRLVKYAAEAYDKQVPLLMYNIWTDWVEWVSRHFYFISNTSVVWHLPFYIWESPSFFWVVSSPGTLKLCFSVTYFVWIIRLIDH